MRFRKSIKITKGVKLNLSKTGASFTVGPGKGLSFNLGTKGAFLNWSIPGTGIYDRVRLDTKVKDILGGKGFLGGLFGGKAAAEDEEKGAVKKNAKGKVVRKAAGVTDEEIAQLEQELALISVACFAPDIESKTAAEGGLEGEAVAAAIEDWLSEAELPVPVDIDLDVCPEKKAILVDLDLPEIEDMPQRKLTELASGEVKIKEKSQKEKRTDYQMCVFGLGEFVAANLLNLIPQADCVLVSAYTQRRDQETGDLNDTYIYSVVFDREAFVEEYQKMDPAEFCGKLKGRFVTLSTGVMKQIVPYEAEDI